MLLLQGIQTALEHFNQYSILWDRDRDVELGEFMKQKPDLSDFELKIKYFKGLQESFMAEAESFAVGPIAIYTGKSTTSRRHAHSQQKYFGVWNS